MNSRFREMQVKKEIEYKDKLLVMKKGLMQEATNRTNQGEDLRS